MKYLAYWLVFVFLFPYDTFISQVKRQVQAQTEVRDDGKYAE